VRLPVDDRPTEDPASRAAPRITPIAAGTAAWVFSVWISEWLASAAYHRGVASTGALNTANLPSLPTPWRRTADASSTTTATAATTTVTPAVSTTSVQYRMFAPMARMRPGGADDTLPPVRSSSLSPMTTDACPHPRASTAITQRDSHVSPNPSGHATPTATTARAASRTRSVRTITTAPAIAVDSVHGMDGADSRST